MEASQCHDLGTSANEQFDLERIKDLIIALSFPSLAHMSEKEYVCAHCRHIFRESDGIGKYLCRTHPVAKREVDFPRTYYPCCGLDGIDQVAIFHTRNAFISPEMEGGCVAADHLPVVGALSPNEVYSRAAHDVHVIACIDPSKDDWLKTLPRVGEIMVGAKEILNPATSLFDFSLTMSDGSETRVNVREQVAAMFDRALTEPAFWKLHDAKKKKYLLYKKFGPGVSSSSVSTGKDPIDIVGSFINRQKPDMAYLRLCVMTLQPPDVRLRFIIVRAVRAEKDTTFLRQLEHQREYVERNSLRDTSLNK